MPKHVQVQQELHDWARSLRRLEKDSRNPPANRDASSHVQLPKSCFHVPKATCIATGSATSNMPQADKRLPTEGHIRALPGTTYEPPGPHWEETKRLHGYMVLYTSIHIHVYISRYTDK